jgi:RimJ/RimL family protein N-acetyltransferase
MEVLSEDGRTYTVDLFKASGKNTKRLWDTFRKFSHLFCDQTAGDYSAFVRWLLDPSTIVVTVDDVGILYATELIPGLDAMVHYFFWDRQVEGRHRVILRVLQWGFETFGLHRINIEVPRHAYTALHRIHRMGLRFEGVRREGQLYKGKWHDILLFGVLQDEITERALEAGRFDRTEHERGWFGFLNRDAQLMQFVSGGGQ